MGKSAAGLLLKVLCNCSDCPRVVTELGVKVCSVQISLINISFSDYICLIYQILFIFNNKDFCMLCLLGTNTKYGHCAGGGQERCYKRLHGK